MGASQHGHVEGASVLNGPSEGASPLANASSALVALLTSVPFGSAAAAMLLCARHSQATGVPTCLPAARAAAACTGPTWAASMDWPQLALSHARCLLDAPPPWLPTCCDHETAAATKKILSLSWQERSVYMRQCHLQLLRFRWL